MFDFDTVSQCTVPYCNVRYGVMHYIIYIGFIPYLRPELYITISYCMNLYRTLLQMFIYITIYILTEKEMYKRRTAIIAKDNVL